MKKIRKLRITKKSKFQNKGNKSKRNRLKSNKLKRNRLKSNKSRGGQKEKLENELIQFLEEITEEDIIKEKKFKDTMLKDTDLLKKFIKKTNLADDNKTRQSCRGVVRNKHIYKNGMIRFFVYLHEILDEKSREQDGADLYVLHDILYNKDEEYLKDESKTKEKDIKDKFEKIIEQYNNRYGNLNNDIKNNLDMSKNNYYYISAHGMTTNMDGSAIFEINKVPQGCTLIFLTPINRICMSRIWDKIFGEFMVRKGCNREIFKLVTDICYRKEEGDILSHRQVFYEGQYYVNIWLSCSDSDMGIWHITPEKNTRERIVDDFKVSDIMKKKGAYVISTCRYYELEQIKKHPPVIQESTIGLKSYLLFVLYFIEKINDIINTHIMECRISEKVPPSCSGNNWKNTMHFTDRDSFKLKRTFSGKLSPVPNPICRKCGQVYRRKGSMLHHGNKVKKDGLCDKCAQKKGKINRLLSIFKKNKK